MVKVNTHHLCLAVCVLTLVLVVVLVVKQNERFSGGCNETLLDSLENQKRHLESSLRNVSPDVRSRKLREIERRISLQKKACGF